MTNAAAKLDDHLRNAGFVDIKVTVKKIPLFPWPKDPKKKVSGSEIGATGRWLTFTFTVDR